MKFKRYSDEECKKMIETGVVPCDAPAWVFEERRRKQQEIEAQIPSPEEEMDAFMRERGGTPPFLSARREDDFFERQEDEEKEKLGWMKSWIEMILGFFRRA